MLMKKVLLTILLALLSVFALRAKEFDVRGPQGGISFKISLPEGFNPETDHCLVIDGESHTITRHRNEVVRQVIDFFRAAE